MGKMHLPGQFLQEGWECRSRSSPLVNSARTSPMRTIKAMVSQHVFNFLSKLFPALRWLFAVLCGRKHPVEQGDERGLFFVAEGLVDLTEIGNDGGGIAASTSRRPSSVSSKFLTPSVCTAGKGSAQSPARSRSASPRACLCLIGNGFRGPQVLSGVRSRRHESNEATRHSGILRTASSMQIPP